MRIKITKSTYKYKEGEIVEVSPNEGFGLIDSGCGIQTKEMTRVDYTATKMTKKRKK